MPDEIRSRPPTTDTYSLPQSQEEFYFSLPYDQMDLCLYGKNNGIPHRRDRRGDRADDRAGASGSSVTSTRSAGPRSTCT